MSNGFRLSWVGKCNDSTVKSGLIVGYNDHLSGVAESSLFVAIVRNRWRRYGLLPSSKAKLIYRFFSSAIDCCNNLRISLDRSKRVRSAYAEVGLRTSQRLPSSVTVSRPLAANLSFLLLGLLLWFVVLFFRMGWM